MAIIFHHGRAVSRAQLVYYDVLDHLNGARGIGALVNQLNVYRCQPERHLNPAREYSTTIRRYYADFLREVDSALACTYISHDGLLTQIEHIHNKYVGFEAFGAPVITFEFEPLRQFVPGGRCICLVKCPEYVGNQQNNEHAGCFSDDGGDDPPCGRQCHAGVYTDPDCVWCNGTGIIEGNP